MQRAFRARPGWGQLLNLSLVCVIWFASFQLSMRYAVLLIPTSLTGKISLELYLLCVQGVALAIGGLASLWLLKGQAAAELGLTRPRSGTLLVGVLLAPGLFAAASYLAVHFALPTLLEELRRGGAQAVRDNAGPVGQAMVQAPIVLALLWGVVMSPIGEELMFRGVLWTTLQRWTERLLPSDASDAPPASASRAVEQFVEPEPLLALFGALGRWLTRGGVATLVSGALFGFLHWDLPGGQGIIRVTASTCLGLACGVARQASGSVLVPIAIHMLFNLLGLAGARRWIVSETFPTHLMVPTLASALGVLGALAAVSFSYALRRAR